jgi:hypothetical protein
MRVLSLSLFAVFAPALLIVFASAGQEEKCQAPAEWFKAGGTDPVPQSFMIDDSTDECKFYKWAWQSFLWLTQTDQGSQAPRFVLFKTPNELFDVGGDKKLQLIAAPEGSHEGKKILSLSVRNSPRTSRDVTAAAVEQAGSQGVLVDRNQRAVYFGLHINDRFVNFIRHDLQLANPDKIKDVELTKEFPPGCLELKSSWRILTKEEKTPDNLKKLQQRFFITEGLVPTLIASTDPDSGKPTVKADPTRPRKEIVALVGLHVVGTIVDHPEFVWASFEHIDNSPTPPKKNLGDNESVDDQKDYTFYRKGKKKKECNVNPVDPLASTLKFIDQNEQTLSPIVDVFREFNSGDDGFTEDDKVRDLNTSVHERLKKGNLSVWSNYKLIGAVWFKDPKKDFVEKQEFKKDELLVGETKLSNSTMETFTQSTKVNCFRCHDTSPQQENDRTLPGLRIKVSHIIRNAYLRPQ